ncbi:RAN guanine nucleotide release factor [Plasmopara halstedii]|uniref:RAN guanine nucleotide release factor n=1 Tax=Plasmopara halstedii TaxID=4781 RepID=A0A0P1AXJ4_PLAHL|nr:RAN guanine nucleotide release factor [Plasmopara halstedii]CEG46313.1 RAN guanine nucleotide release factor [Plasmopara halstedii]|eukprot:XP_024582682.1 RAN guanine nucleotide release factor [Plasmopara halstedii]
MLRLLFGGALSCEIPEDFVDVSSFRQVPDNQEVFANATTDQCVIVELLQFEESVDDNQSARYFFNEIAQSNGCGPDEVAVLLEEKTDTKLTGVDVPHIMRIIVGDQCVAKFKEGDHAKNVVRVYLGNIRLPSVTTDVVLSVSAPMRINPASSSRNAFQFEDNSEVSVAIFKQALHSFAVKDWSLFT